jgi:Ca2+-binding EF-hand superfamily protein
MEELKEAFNLFDTNGTGAWHIRSLFSASPV